VVPQVMSVMDTQSYHVIKKIISVHLFIYLKRF
jgi:hypothetical protein